MERAVCRQHPRPRGTALRAGLALIVLMLLVQLSGAAAARAVAPVVDPLIEPVLDTALIAGAPAYACNSGDWYGPADGCKYAKAKVETTCVNNCNSVDIDAVKWRGGTATGGCDPTGTNDITQWRLRWIKIVRVTDDAVRWQRGASAWHYNCDVNANTYVENPGLRVGVDHVVKYKWEHVSASSGPFYPRLDLHVAAR